MHFVLSLNLSWPGCICLFVPHSHFLFVRSICICWFVSFFVHIAYVFGLDVRIAFVVCLYYIPVCLFVCSYRVCVRVGALCSFSRPQLGARQKFICLFVLHLCLFVLDLFLFVRNVLIFVCLFVLYSQIIYSYHVCVCLFVCIMFVC